MFMSKYMVEVFGAATYSTAVWCAELLDILPSIIIIFDLLRNSVCYFDHLYFKLLITKKNTKLIL